MHIHIKGRNKSFTKAEIEYTVSFLTEHLLGKKLADNITLNISYEDLGTNYAQIFPVDYDDTRKNREFELTLDKHFSKEYDPKLLLTTLAHELVHLKQFARGELKNFSVDAYKWKGELVDIPESKAKYVKTPWEQEAYSREKELYDVFLDELRRVNFETELSNTNG